MCICADEIYLNRPAETLVLQGYRNWTMGIATRDMDYWSRAWNLFSTKLGPERARPCMDALVIFVKTLGLCASCPLKTLDPSCKALCRDECLVIGLISALQHGDEAAIKLCSGTLACPSQCDEVAFAASQFAMALKMVDFTLCPVPLATLSEIALGDMPSRSLH